MVEASRRTAPTSAPKCSRTTIPSAIRNVRSRCTVGGALRYPAGTSAKGAVAVGTGGGGASVVVGPTGTGPLATGSANTAPIAGALAEAGVTSSGSAPDAGSLTRINGGRPSRSRIACSPRCNLLVQCSPMGRASSGKCLRATIPCAAAYGERGATLCGNGGRTATPGGAGHQGIYRRWKRRGRRVKTS